MYSITETNLWCEEIAGNETFPPLYGSSEESAADHCFRSTPMPGVRGFLTPGRRCAGLPTTHLTPARYLG
ncbi:hypothetical protein GCM10027068_20670 [Prescottella soli]